MIIFNTNHFKLLSLILIAALTTSCVKNINIGERLHGSHNVSVVKLIGDSQWFNNEPVNIIGVAGFDFNFEGTSKIYASVDDQRFDTFTYIELKLPKEYSVFEKQLTPFNGKFISVQGVYHAYKEHKLEKGVWTICNGICGSNGYIYVLSIFTR